MCVYYTCYKSPFHIPMTLQSINEFSFPNTTYIVHHAFSAFTHAKSIVYNYMVNSPKYPHDYLYSLFLLNIINTLISIPFTFITVKLQK